MSEPVPDPRGSGPAGESSGRHRGQARSNSGLVVRRLGRAPYEPTWEAMRSFSATREPATPDELWLLEHPPVFTLGMAGKPEDLLRDAGIPLVRTDRGGQITYHGPGQLVAYLLLDLRRRGLGVRDLVWRMEQAIIELLAGWGIRGERRAGAPGVYVADAKIAALGLRVRGGCSTHGLALNVDMDLAPFAAINPCGYSGLAVTQLRDLGVGTDTNAAGERLSAILVRVLGGPRELDPGAPRAPRL
ncbi:MAG: lipoyl(octanoyl) transferase LipB [Betaproteobacteria bacterium]|nr:lipoyl(octanoyl) transferase LipB [Betaproteobacteria bacterium]